jgi:pyruvate dehydrogenase E2 component (dihydrolipoamide acetyltransferase)
MASEIQLPELGENVESGEVVDVKVSPGAEVKEGQALLEVEAEKTTVEVPAPGPGRIAKVLVKKGDKVKTGQSLFLLEGDGAAKSAPQAEAAPAQETPSAPKEPAAAIVEPKVKASPPPPPKEEPAPTVEQRPAPAPVGNGRRTQAPERPTPSDEKIVPAGPATRRLARELGVELARVRGTAPGGRVTQEDVKAFVKELAAGTAAPVGRPTAIAAPPLPDFERWGPVERKPLDSVRRKTAEQMALAWSRIPHVTQHDEADITDLEAFRKQQRDARGPKLTVTAFALKAVAIALKEYPQFNASLDLASGQLIYKHYYHLGLAVDTERGLLVPIIRDVDRKSVFDLAREMGELAERARQKKLAGDEMRGGTFTITNLGGIGGTAFTPIINYPEVAILGLSRSRLQPVVRVGLVVPRLLLPLSLSYDHRVIDGADAARFARRLVEMLENPLVMLLHA